MSNDATHWDASLGARVLHVEFGNRGGRGRRPTRRDLHGRAVRPDCRGTGRASGLRPAACRLRPRRRDLDQHRHLGGAVGHADRAATGRAGSCGEHQSQRHPIPYPLALPEWAGTSFRAFLYRAARGSRPIDPIPQPFGRRVTCPVSAAALGHSGGTALDFGVSSRRDRGAAPGGGPSQPDYSPSG